MKQRPHNKIQIDTTNHPQYTLKNHPKFHIISHCFSILESDLDGLGEKMNMPLQCHTLELNVRSYKYCVNLHTEGG